MQHQVFISYRRDGGEAMAQLIHDKLVERGYRVFYDIESLNSGLFDAKLYDKIEECEDFVLILPPQALDRTVYEEDWVRKEIKHALELNKNIVPIMMRGFVFPQNLPEDIRIISSFNGVDFGTMQYLDARIGRVVSMLKSVPEDLTVAPSRPPVNQTGKRSMLIRNICSLGSCDFNNAFPKDAHFSEVIDRDRYNLVYFNLSIAPIKNKSTIKIGMAIYNSKNQQVFEDVSELKWQESYDCARLPWTIRGLDNSFVNAGIYRAEFWVEDSDVYEYTFKITSSSQSALTTPSDPQVVKLSKQPKAPYFKAALLNVLAFFLFLFFSVSIGGMPFLVLLFATLYVITLVWLIRFSLKYVTKSGFFAFIFPTLGNSIYTFYLLIMAVINLFKKA